MAEAFGPITVIDLWPVLREYFGRCYLCRWNQCDDCIGPPCWCLCEWPKRITRVDRLFPILDAEKAKGGA